MFVKERPETIRLRNEGYYDFDHRSAQRIETDKKERLLQVSDAPLTHNNQDKNITES